MKKNLVISMTAMVTILVLVIGLVIPVLASGSQSWNLDSHEDADILSPASLCQMERTGGPGDNGQSGSILLTTSMTQTWIADESATADVRFGGGDGAWVLELVTDVDWNTDGTDCIVEIGEWDGTQFNGFLSTSQDNPPDVEPIPGNPYQLIITYVWQDFEETVHDNCYLAIRVTNDDTMNHIIYCGEEERSSCLTSPGTNPGYPTPEYPPVVPVSSGAGTAAMIGILALLSAVILRRKSVKRISPQ
jgi:hypothetical protein